MNKKILLIGLLLLIISVVVLFIGGDFVLNGASLVSNQLQSTNVTISPDNFSYIALTATNASYFVFLAKISNSTNFYVFNQSGFIAWKSGVRSANGVSGIRYAISLENKGAFLIYKGTSTPTLPPLQSSNPSLIYTYNDTLPYPEGSYYFVVDNTNGSASSQMRLTAQLVYAPPINNQSIESGQLGSIPRNLITSELIVSGTFLVLFIAGLCVSLYGLVKKAPETSMDDLVKKGEKVVPATGKVDQKYVDELYKGIGKKKKAKR